MRGATEEPANGATTPARVAGRPSSTSTPLRREQPAWLQRHFRLLVAVDVASGIAAVLVSQVVAFGVQHAQLEVRGIRIPYATAILAVVPAWTLLLSTAGCYDVAPLGTSVGEARRVANAGTRFLALMAVAYYVLHLQQLGRGFTIAIVPLAAGFSMIGRLALRYQLHVQRKHGRAVRRALVMGPRDQSSQMLEHLAHHPEAGITPVAVLLPDGVGTLRANGSEVPIAGTPDDALQALGTTGADLLLITGNLANGGLRSLTWTLQGTGVDVLVAPTVTQLASFLDVRPVAGLPLLYVDRASLPATAAD